MELFMHYSPSNENREKLMAAIEETKAFATGEPHRFESLHSTLAYLGEVDESRLPELRAIITKIASNHKPLNTYGERLYLSHETYVYNAWGLIYIWHKTPEIQALYDELCEELKAADFWSDPHDYTPHSTLYMKYYPNNPDIEELPSFPQCTDCFDRIYLSQVTVVDGHVAYYPLYEETLKS